jgi:putative oxidoreductase
METGFRLLALTSLRVVTGFLFFQHGAPKLLASWPGNEPGDTAEFLSLIWFSGILEFIGGPLIMLGLLTRPVAFVLAGEMAVAYFLRHAPAGFWPGSNRGELAALYCFVFLYFSARGAGPLSLDARLRTREPG